MEAKHGYDEQGVKVEKDGKEYTLHQYAEFSLTPAEMVRDILTASVINQSTNPLEVLNEMAKAEIFSKDPFVKKILRGGSAADKVRYNLTRAIDILCQNRVFLKLDGFIISSTTSERLNVLALNYNCTGEDGKPLFRPIREQDGEVLAEDISAQDALPLSVLKYADREERFFLFGYMENSLILQKYYQANVALPDENPQNELEFGEPTSPQRVVELATVSVPIIPTARAESLEWFSLPKLIAYIGQFATSLDVQTKYMLNFLFPYDKYTPKKKEEKKQKEQEARFRTPPYVVHSHDAFSNAMPEVSREETIQRKLIAKKNEYLANKRLSKDLFASISYTIENPRQLQDILVDGKLSFFAFDKAVLDAAASWAETQTDKDGNPLPLEFSDLERLLCFDVDRKVPKDKKTQETDVTTQEQKGSPLLRRIGEALLKLESTLTKITLDEAIRNGLTPPKGMKDGELIGRLLEFRILKEKDSNGEERKFVIITKSPILATYAQSLGQVSRLDKELLEVRGVNNTPENLSLKYYLLSRVDAMKGNPTLSRKILYSTMFPACEITFSENPEDAKRERIRCRERVEKILKHFKMKGFIQGFEETKDPNGRIDGVELDVPKNGDNK